MHTGAEAENKFEMSNVLKETEVLSSHILFGNAGFVTNP